MDFRAEISDSVATMLSSTKMLSVSLAAQAKLASLDNLTLGKIICFDGGFTKSLTTNLENLTCSYKSLIDSAITHESFKKDFPFVATFAPIEYFREVDVLESITVENIDEAGDEPVEKSITEILPFADDLLAEFDGRLCSLLHGARQSLQGNNPDRARHIITSIRELLTQVLHALAPDNEVFKWTSKPELFHNNRPTREARLLFICRNINDAPLSRFVKDDVRAYLSFWIC
jgi:hypothetical protein